LPSLLPSWFLSCVRRTHATFEALLALWPSWLSYAVSYLFIAIVWANHHYLLHHATEATPRLMWFNFAHLFSVSLLPLSTAWMAISRLSPQPVAFYAAVFFFVNVTYMLLIWELIEPAALSPKACRNMRIDRSRHLSCSERLRSRRWNIPMSGSAFAAVA
jgi:uncharacterized membrane protein